MKNFFKSVLINTLKTITSFFLILIFSFIIIAIISPKEKKEIKEKSILYLKLDQTIKDQNKEEDFNFSLNSLNTKSSSLESILKSSPISSTIMSGDTPTSEMEFPDGR